MLVAVVSSVHVSQQLQSNISSQTTETISTVQDAIKSYGVAPVKAQHPTPARWPTSAAVHR